MCPESCWDPGSASIAGRIGDKWMEESCLSESILCVGPRPGGEEGGPGSSMTRSIMRAAPLTLHFRSPLSDPSSWWIWLWVLAPGPQVYPQQQQRSAGCSWPQSHRRCCYPDLFLWLNFFTLLSPYYITQCYKLDLITQATSGLTVILGNLSCQFKILPFHLPLAPPWRRN